MTNKKKNANGDILSPELKEAAIKLLLANENDIGDHVNKESPLVEAITSFKWEATGDSCPECAEGNIERLSGMMIGPWGGRIRCTNCSYEDTVAKYLVDSMVGVEPIRE
jgi:transposase-like protein